MNPISYRNARTITPSVEALGPPAAALLACVAKPGAITLETLNGQRDVTIPLPTPGVFVLPLAVKAVTDCTGDVAIIALW